jgi:hypothetical protein
MAARVVARPEHRLTPIDDLGPAATCGGDCRSKIIKTSLEFIGTTAYVITLEDRRRLGPA